MIATILKDIDNIDALIRQGIKEQSWKSDEPIEVNIPVIDNPTIVGVLNKTFEDEGWNITIDKSGLVKLLKGRIRKYTDDFICYN